MNGTLSIKLQEDDTLCVVESNGKVCLQTNVSVQKLLDLAESEVIETNEYKVTKPSPDVIRLEFMCNRLWVTQQIRIKELLELALMQGF